MSSRRVLTSATVAILTVLVLTVAVAPAGANERSKVEVTKAIPEYRIEPGERFHINIGVKAQIKAEDLTLNYPGPRIGLYVKIFDKMVSSSEVYGSDDFALASYLYLYKLPRKKDVSLTNTITTYGYAPERGGVWRLWAFAVVGEFFEYNQYWLISGNAFVSKPYPLQVQVGSDTTIINSETETASTKTESRPSTTFQTTTTFKPVQSSARTVLKSEMSILEQSAEFETSIPIQTVTFTQMGVDENVPLRNTALAMSITAAVFLGAILLLEHRKRRRQTAFCIECGRRIDREASFCDRCGAKQAKADG